MNELRTSRVDDVDVTVPVLKARHTTEKLVALLRAQLDAMKLPRIRRNDHAMAIRRLEAYLSTLAADSVDPSESLLDAMEDWLVQGDEARRSYHRKTTSHIRSIVNAIPEAVRNRRLLTDTELRRLRRFDAFTPETKDLLLRFQSDGRKVKRTPIGIKPTSALLSPSVRESAAYAATMLMRLVGVDDVRRVTSDHVDQYLRHEGEDGRENAIHTLWNMRALFRHLVAAGAMAEDPLDGLAQQKSRANHDYIPADEINKLSDLATLDATSFPDVRDRLIAYALCYDCGLRIGEVARLRLDDVRVGDFVEVTLPGNIQKGSGKAAATLRNLFPESKRLFELYLVLRPASGHGALLVSEAGKPLMSSGCRNAVKRVSEALGIRTHDGKMSCPHRYRHSLGTLNVGELGMRLSPYYLMRRYRHNDLKVTTDVYVAHNPLLDEAQHVAIVNAANGNGHALEPQPRSMASDMNVPEQEAMSKVRSLGINWRSLREHAVGEKAAGERNGRTHYSASWLDRLCTEWMTRAEAMRLMGITSLCAYRHRVGNHGIGTLLVGRASLAKSADVIRSLRR